MNPKYRWTCLRVFGKRTLARNFLILWSWGAIPRGVIVLPRNCTLITPKWHFSIVSFRPAMLMHSKTALMLCISWATELAAIPMSSTYWAHWSAFLLYPGILSWSWRMLKVFYWVLALVVCWQKFCWRSWMLRVRLISGQPFGGNGMLGSN